MAMKWANAPTEPSVRAGATSVGRPQDCAKKWWQVLWCLLLVRGLGGCSCCCTQPCAGGIVLCPQVPSSPGCSTWHHTGSRGQSYTMWCGHGPIRAACGAQLFARSIWSPTVVSERLLYFLITSVGEILMQNVLEEPSRGWTYPWEKGSVQNPPPPASWVGVWDTNKSEGSQVKCL